MNANFKDKTIYVGMDVHKKTCELKVLSENLSLSNVVCLSPYNGAIIHKYLTKNYPNGNYKCVYEAGFSGFWLQRELSNLGVNCIIVNPSDVPTSNKDSVHKTDKVDAIKLARALRANQLVGIYVPTKDQEQARSLVRQRMRIKGSIKQFKNRIMSHYNFLGLDLDWEEGKLPVWWSRNKIRQLRVDANERGDLAMEGYLDTIVSLRQQELKSLKRIRELALTPPYKMLYEALLKIKGVGSINAMIYITELMTMKRFKKFDYLQSLVGLIPTQNSSSDSDRRGHITNRSNGIVKTALNQTAWSAVRFNPEMTIYYEDQKSRVRKSQLAIIKVMVKMLRKIRYVWHQVEIKQLS